MENYAFHPPDLYKTHLSLFTVHDNKSVPKSRREVRKDESHPLFQESKENRRLRFF